MAVVAAGGLIRHFPGRRVNLSRSISSSQCSLHSCTKWPVNGSKQQAQVEWYQALRSGYCTSSPAHALNNHTHAMPFRCPAPTTATTRSPYSASLRSTYTCRAGVKRDTSAEL